eukprot:12915076-Prorocentrum_lima.AAC.1
MSRQWPNGRWKGGSSTPSVRKRGKRGSRSQHHFQRARNKVHHQQPSFQGSISQEGRGDSQVR